MLLNVDDNRIAMAIPPLLRLAFRPLFLGGVLFAIIAMAWWSYFWVQPFHWQPYGGPIWWHGHEMLFGFGAAIVVGFLLTAVQTWTGVIGLRGKPLALLAASWLLGRLLIAFGASLPDLMVAVGDALYLFLATLAMAYPVIRVRQWRNLIFVPMLLLLASLNISSHWGVLTEQPELAQRSLHGAILVITLMITVLGGRVIPFFTANGTGTQKAQPIKWLEVLSVASIFVLVLVALIGFNQVPALFMLALCSIAALFNGWRFLRWGFQRCWHIPLLWSLHLSYAFIPLGLLVLALQSIGYVDNISAALHMFTVGAIGGMILAMISRVTLGHTGRPLNPPRLIALAYSCILLAAIMRVVLSGWFPAYSQLGIAVAGVLWVIAYSIYVIFYGPMLVATRADGRPG